ncbi:hypothetical protein [Mucilaginibacter paludis]|uniref:Uncharacterized protein n=1 Tax=Mucilaginibacter paludis DSM 18603 TaxID=714943 RepID=H1YIE5_9SPHI|nr:hypothetical protein [Mucilaginibacter paludis]EHQ27558.1 hypothetical protein Mucpa_3459 [Mucilaginibacter paludis DSM 18603]
MTERQIYKALKLIQKRTMKPEKLKRICEKLIDLGLAGPVDSAGTENVELTIKGKIFIWDYENWKLTS